MAVYMIRGYLMISTLADLARNSAVGFRDTATQRHAMKTPTSHVYGDTSEKSVIRSQEMDTEENSPSGETAPMVIRILMDRWLHRLGEQLICYMKQIITGQASSDS